MEEKRERKLVEEKKLSTECRLVEYERKKSGRESSILYRDSVAIIGKMLFLLKNVKHRLWKKVSTEDIEEKAWKWLDLSFMTRGRESSTWSETTEDLIRSNSKREFLLFDHSDDVGQERLKTTLSNCPFAMWNTMRRQILPNRVTV